MISSIQPCWYECRRVCIYPSSHAFSSSLPARCLSIMVWQPQYGKTSGALSHHLHNRLFSRRLPSPCEAEGVISACWWHDTKKAPICWFAIGSQPPNYAAPQTWYKPGNVWYRRSGHPSTMWSPFPHLWPPPRIVNIYHKESRECDIVVSWNLPSQILGENFFLRIEYVNKAYDDM